MELVAGRDDGAHVTDGLIEGTDARDAIATAEKMGRAPGYCAAWAFSRRGIQNGIFIKTRRSRGLARFAVTNSMKRPRRSLLFSEWNRSTVGAGQCG